MPIDANFSAIADDLYVWLPRQRGWGLANCGLLASRRGGLWIDAPYDQPSARLFLDASERVLGELGEGAGAGVSRVVVTHANGDHLWGARVLPDAEVIVRREALAHLHYDPTPQQQHALLNGDGQGALFRYLRKHFGGFDWDGLEAVRPDTVFAGELELRVGEYPVRVFEVPSAHTGGDLMVHLPRQGAVFTGDVVFGSTAEQPGDHPVHWAGPLSNVVRGVDAALATGAEVFVPGHGPVLDREGMRAYAAYVEYVAERAAELYRAGVPAVAAARVVIGERRYPELGLAERVVVTVGTEFRHLALAEGGSVEVPGVLEVMGALAGVAEELEELEAEGVSAA